MGGHQAWFFKDIYASSAICNLHRINDQFRTVGIIKFSNMDESTLGRCLDMLTKEFVFLFSKFIRSALKIEVS